MDSEITESEKTAQEIEVLVTPAEETEDGKEVTKKIKASFRTTSQLPRHTRSDKVFGALYNESRPIALVQPGAMWCHPSKMNSWTLTKDGPRINILGQYASYEKSAMKEISINKVMKKKGYKTYPGQSYPTKNWLVMRRSEPVNQPYNETLAANIIYFAQRKIRLQEADFAEQIKQKNRPLEKPQARPDTLADMHPRALDETKQAQETIVKETKAKLQSLKKNLPRNKFLKAKSKAKKQQYRALKALISHVPRKVREHDQKFAALAWLVSPKYHMLDEDTKYFGRKALDETDPVPDKVFESSDFDEAMVINVLQTFSTEEECLEFIDNKAKHDLEYCNITCITMYESVPLDMMLTNSYFANVPRTYHTELQQQVIVDKEKMNKAALETAKNNPDMVKELTIEDGQTVVKESNATKAIAQELQAEKEKTDKLYQETMEELEKLRLEEEQEGGAIKEQTTQDNTQEDIKDSEEVEVD